MNNAWSEMVSCSPCFAFYCCSSLHWFTQTICDKSYLSSDQHGSLISTLVFSHASSIIFLLATSNLMLYPLHILQCILHSNGLNSTSHTLQSLHGPAIKCGYSNVDISIGGKDCPAPPLSPPPPPQFEEP